MRKYKRLLRREQRASELLAEASREVVPKSDGQVRRFSVVTRWSAARSVARCRWPLTRRNCLRSRSCRPRTSAAPSVRPASSSRSRRGSGRSRSSRTGVGPTRPPPKADRPDDEPAGHPRLGSARIAGHLRMAASAVCGVLQRYRLARLRQLLNQPIGPAGPALRTRPPRADWSISTSRSGATFLTAAGTAATAELRDPAPTPSVHRSPTTAPIRGPDAGPDVASDHPGQMPARLRRSMRLGLRACVCRNAVVRTVNVW